MFGGCYFYWRFDVSSGIEEQGFECDGLYAQNDMMFLSQPVNFKVLSQPQVCLFMVFCILVYVRF